MSVSPSLTDTFTSPVGVTLYPVSSLIAVQFVQFGILLATYCSSCHCVDSVSVYELARQITVCIPFAFPNRYGLFGPLVSHSFLSFTSPNLPQVAKSSSGTCLLLPVPPGYPGGYGYIVLLSNGGSVSPYDTFIVLYGGLYCSCMYLLGFGAGPPS